MCIYIYIYIDIDIDIDIYMYIYICVCMNIYTTPIYIKKIKVTKVRNVHILKEN